MAMMYSASITSNQELIPMMRLLSLQRQKSKEDRELAKTLIQNHIKTVLCDGSDSEYQYVNYFLCLIFDETQSFMPRSCPIFSGIPGAGKTKLIWKKLCTGDKSDLGALGSMEPFIGKKFVTLDEGHITNERGYTNFKSLITEDFIWARLMYQALAKYLNYSVFILLTNQSTGIEPMAANESNQIEWPVTRNILINYSSGSI